MNASAFSSNPENGALHSVSRVRVRYSETDAMGWVYYACYLHYFEVARSDLIRERWKSYRKIEDEDGLRLPVIETGCSYFDGARYEDELDVSATLRLNGAKLRFEYVVNRAGSNELIARGFTVHCFVDQRGKPRRAPAAFLKLFGS